MLACRPLQERGARRGRRVANMSSRSVNADVVWSRRRTSCRPVPFSPDCRHEPCAWAERKDAVVVEDDYDAEYRSDREPIGAVQGLSPERVVYASSSGKTLGPCLRLGWLWRLR